MGRKLSVLVQKRRKPRVDPGHIKTELAAGGLEEKGVVESRAILNAFLCSFYLLLHKYFFSKGEKGTQIFLQAGKPCTMGLKKRKSILRESGSFSKTKNSPKNISRFCPKSEGKGKTITLEENGENWNWAISEKPPKIRREIEKLDLIEPDCWRRAFCGKIWC